MMLLSAMFLGGYYLGHQTDSPDIFAWAKEKYQQVSMVNDALAGVSNPQSIQDIEIPGLANYAKPADWEDRPAEEKVAVEAKPKSEGTIEIIVDGRRYTLGPDGRPIQK